MKLERSQMLGILIVEDNRAYRAMLFPVPIQASDFLHTRGSKYIFFPEKYHLQCIYYTNPFGYLDYGSKSQYYHGE